MLLWISAAIVIAIVVLAVLAVFLWRRPDPEEVVGAEIDAELEADNSALPMSPLQKRAWWALGIGLVLLAAIAAILVGRGAASYSEDVGYRMLVTALFLGALIAGLGVQGSLVWGARQGGSLLDERDRKIMGQAPLVQSAAVILAVMAWAIGLTEYYHDQGTVPVVFMYLMAMSCLLVHVLAGSAGILLGHWRESRHA